MHGEIPSASSTNSDYEEVPRDDQDEKKITLGDALTMNRANETSPSFEQLQNLAGGADIKVLSLLGLFYMKLLVIISADYFGTHLHQGFILF